MAKLPEKYRAPFVLCVFENQPVQEVAKALGKTPNAISARLRLARQRLQARLQRRGVSLEAILTLGAVTGASEAAIPTGLTERTVSGAAAACHLSREGAGWLAVTKGRLVMVVGAVLCLGIGVSLAWSVPSSAARDSAIPPSPDGNLVAAAPVFQKFAATELKCDDPVTAMTFTFDSRYLIAGEKTGRISVWDMHSGQRVASVCGHNDAVGQLSYVSGGNRGVTCYTSRETIYLSVPNLDEGHAEDHKYCAFPTYVSNVKGANLIADGNGRALDQRLFVRDLNPREMAVWYIHVDFFEGNLRYREKQLPQVQALAYQCSPESDESEPRKTIDPRMHFVLGCWRPKSSRAEEKFSTELDCFVAATNDGKMCINVPGKELVQISESALPFHVQDIAAMLFTDRRDRLLVTTHRREVHEFDTSNGKLLVSHRLASGQPVGFVWRPKKPALLSSIKEGGFEMWDFVSGKRICDFGGPAHASYVTASYDGRVIASADGRTIRFWDAEMGKPTKIGLKTVGSK